MEKPEKTDNRKEKYPYPVTILARALINSKVKRKALLHIPLTSTNPRQVLELSFRIRSMILLAFFGIIGWMAYGFFLILGLIPGINTVIGCITLCIIVLMILFVIAGEIYQVGEKIVRKVFRR